MNVAYLDPAHSRHFHLLAGVLASPSGRQPLALLSSSAYRLYTGSDRALVWQPGTTAEVHDIPREFASASWARRDDGRAVAAFSHAVEWLKQRFLEEPIDLCLVFSDARPFSVAARLAAEASGVVIVYFERGAFRYSTSSLSTLGLNSRFSLRRALSIPELTGVPANDPLQRRPVEPWLRLRFANFIVRNAVACLINGDRHRIQHKRYALKHYLHVAWSQWRAEYDNARNRAAELAVKTARPLVVVPLQLPIDSQLALHSPFRDNQHFIDFVAQHVRRLAPEAAIVFKHHPMDATRYRLPEGAHIVSGNLARFHDAGPIFVCINSTVGFEALVRGERVICFAPSFYSDAPALVMTSPETFAGCFARVLGSQGDAESGSRLRVEMLRCYQAPGDAWAYLPVDLQDTAKVVLKHYHAARRAQLSAPLQITSLPASVETGRAIA